MTEKEKARQRAKAAKLTPRPVELPSGRWRCQVMHKGKRISAVEDDPVSAHTKVMALREGLIQDERPATSLTVGEAIDRYIDSKSAVLSPATVAGYKRIRKNGLQGLMGVRLSDLTQEAIQREVNVMARTHSPKSVANAHGLLSAALTAYVPDMAIRTTLPQKAAREATIPSDSDMEKILDAARGTKIELPILLAAWMGLRASEIIGITWDAINGSTLHVKQAIVTGEGGKQCVKAPKTAAGDRYLPLPPHIVDLIQATPRTGDRLIPTTGQALYKAFSRLCAQAGVPHYRLHDLRHYQASVMLAAGVPDRYAQERMGHATTNMLKTVYQHTMAAKRQEVAQQVDDYFNSHFTHVFTHAEKET